MAPKRKQPNGRNGNGGRKTTNAVRVRRNLPNRRRAGGAMGAVGFASSQVQQLSGSDFLSSVSMPRNLGGSNYVLLDLGFSPIELTGTRWAQLSTMYEKYRFLKCRLVYVPAVSSVVGGQLITYFELDPTDDVEQGDITRATRVAMAHQAAKLHNVYDSVAIDLPLATGIADFFVEKAAPSDELTAYRRWTQQARIRMIATASLTGLIEEGFNDQVVGSVYLQWVCRFKNPQIQPSLSVPSQSISGYNYAKLSNVTAPNAVIQASPLFMGTTDLVGDVVAETATMPDGLMRYYSPAGKKVVIGGGELVSSSIDQIRPPSGSSVGLDFTMGTIGYQQEIVDLSGADDSAWYMSRNIIAAAALAQVCQPAPNFAVVDGDTIQKCRIWNFSIVNEGRVSGKDVRLPVSYVKMMDGSEWITPRAVNWASEEEANMYPVPGVAKNLGASAFATAMGKIGRFVGRAVQDGMALYQKAKPYIDAGVAVGKTLAPLLGLIPANDRFAAAEILWLQQAAKLAGYSHIKVCEAYVQYYLSTAYDSNPVWAANSSFPSNVNSMPDRVTAINFLIAAFPGDWPSQLTLIPTAG